MGLIAVDVWGLGLEFVPKRSIFWDMEERLNNFVKILLAISVSAKALENKTKAWRGPIGILDPAEVSSPVGASKSLRLFDLMESSWFVSSDLLDGRLGGASESVLFCAKRL